MQASLEYVSVGVNRVVNALAWGEHGGVAYAAHHMVALYDVKSARVLCTISGHTDTVNCVLWLPQGVTPGLPDGCHILASGSADGSVRLWLVQYRSAPAAATSAEWHPLALLSGHSGPVTSLTVHGLAASAGQGAPTEPTADGGSAGLLMVSTAGDGNVIVWACEAPAAAPAAAAALPGQSPSELVGVGESYGQGCWKEQQCLHVGTRIQTTAAMTHLPLDPDWTLLATGGTDRRITLYVRRPGSAARFEAACVLEGHENWVRGVAFTHVAADDQEAEPSGSAATLLLASVSQDRYGRIWKLQAEPLPAAAAETGGGGAAEVFAAAGEDPLAALIRRYAPRPHVDTATTRYVATSEALLIGHEDWVHGLQWAPPPPPVQPRPAEAAAEAGAPDAAAAAARPAPPLRTRSSAALLTSSMDRTMIVWRYEAASGLWMNESAVGDAGASCLGYFGGVWSPDGEAILAHGFTGALHLWRLQSASAPLGYRMAAPEPRLWVPQHALGGHVGAVVDLCWGVDSACLLSVSEDQTARLHSDTATRARGGEGGASGSHGNGLHWCEVARPQVHGHDFRCVAHVATPPGSDYMYVSGSEEKVLRVFEAPQAFIDSLVALRGGEGSELGGAIARQGRRGHGFGAAVAALGLSNKAVFDANDEGGGGANAGVGSDVPGGDYTEGPDFAPCAAPQVISEPPLEEHLAQNTLWPETHKLYGHGNDVYCVAASPDGRFLASACRAQTAATASVWVWCTRTWRAVAQLKAHTLTVTQLAWSHSGSFLAAASRDRTFSVFARREPLGDPQQDALGQRDTDAPAAAGGGAASGAEARFELLHRAKAAHGRVIWGVSWSPDDRLLATASRDESVKAWWTGCAAAGGPSGGAAAPAASPGVPSLAVALPAFPCAATAVAFAPSAPDGGSGRGSSYVLAVGLESGAVELWSLGGEGEPAPTGLRAPSRLWCAPTPWRHVASVRRLCWRPQEEGTQPTGALQLASGSEDHSLRVYAFAV